MSWKSPVANPTSDPRPRETATITVPLRWRDLDHLGHVYHAVMLTLLDEARTGFFHRHLDIDSPDSYVIARIEIDYVGEVRRDAVDIAVNFSVLRVGNSSLTTVEQVTVGGGRVVARAVVTSVQWDSQERRPRALSEQQRQQARCFAPDQGPVPPPTTESQVSE